MKRLILDHRRVVLFLVVILFTYGMSAISLAQNSNVGDILSPGESRNVVATNRGDGSWVIESVTPGDMTLTIEGVNIPDPNLRTAIETVLGKAAGAPITVADMKTLTSLFARNANISNLTGLEHATNLTDLGLDQNSISDVSPLSGLSNLWRLTLTTNSISDVSPLSELTNLSRLKLFENSISDVSALSGLTNLTLLNLGYNSISDLSPLVENTGLGSGDTVNVQDNPLNTESISAHIPALRQRGVEVLGYAPPPMSSPAVNIPDSNLRAAIETALGKAAGAPITVADMETLTSLTARDANISNLTGLEHATNLTRLALFNNRVSDLSPISGLTNLTWLDLNTNHVSDLSPVSGLTNLTGLTLYNNRLSDLSPLVSNTGLGAGETVDVRENSLNSASISAHIPALQQRGVEVLFDTPPPVSSPAVNIPDPNLRAAIETALGKAAGAPITVADMETLTSLTARDANISNLTGLEHATNLTDLDLIGNSISDVSALAGLTNLTDLGLTQNSISDVSALSGLTNLWRLELTNNSISDVSALSGLTNLSRLKLYGNSISDVSALSGLTNLTWLNLAGNSISDVSALAGLTNLTGLSIYYNAISDLSPLVANTGLGSGEEVDARGNPLNTASINTHIPALQQRGVTVLFDPPQTVNIPDANLRAAIETALGKAAGAPITVADMETLTRLTARDANISNLTGLEHATNLGSLDLTGNSISNLSPLSSLINLTDLVLDQNSISDVSALSGLTNLRRLRLQINSISNVAPLSGLAYLDRLLLYKNSISDVSALSGLTNLTALHLGYNSISDVSALEGLTNLTQLAIYDNTISDLSPLVANTGLGSGDTVEADGNPLSNQALQTHIPTLQRRGVTVFFDPPQSVNIPDANLRAAIETALGKAAGAPITVSAMETLTYLGAANANISNLTGLEHAINLTELILSSNSISDLSPISGLTNLTTLILSSNSISDLSPISGLTNLTGLVLSSNSTSDLSPISGLTNLTELYLQNNSISDLSPISGLTTLTRLVLFDNSISDISVVSALTNLTTLDLFNNSISDLSPISGLTNLTTLDLFNNSISDLSPISGLTNLTWLGLFNNSISDLSPISGLTNLTELYLQNNSISDLSPLVSNTGLERGDSVWVEGNPLSSQSIQTHIPTLQRRRVTVHFDAIAVEEVNIPDPNLRRAVEAALGKAAGAPITVADMETLTSLIARDANISNLTGLEHATNLTDLDLIGNSISNLSPLSSLINLTDLMLDQNSISDVSALSGLTNLWRLTLTTNSISDVSPLSGLTNLSRLKLYENSISDVSALSGLTTLTWLNLAGNSISDVSALAGLTNLTGLTIYDNTISDLSPLVANTGLGSGEEVDARENPLNTASINSHIPTLQQRGVTVFFDPPQTVNIPDPYLRRAVEAALGKAAGAPITVADMETLYELEFFGGNISNLTGLEHAANLTRLNLDNDLTSLALDNGDMMEDDMTDISPISALDLSPLSGLTNLTGLYLGYNSISDVSPLAGLINLTELSLAGNSISNIAPLSGLTNLSWLDLGYNSISDVSALAGLTNLTGLTIYHNAISDLSPLVANTGLGSGEEVDARGNPLNTASINTHIPILQGRGVTVLFDPPQTVNIPDPNLRAAIETALGKAAGAPITVVDMQNLTALTARDANISNLTGLEHATNLTDLDLIGNSISNLSPLSSLINLTDLGLDQNSISDVSALSGLTNLWRLTLNSNSISDVSPLSELTNLSRLKLYENSISDVSALSGLTTLTWLNLGYNSISDVSALAGLTNLTGLTIYHNAILDLSPLVANTGLESGEEVDARENPLNTASINTHIPNLQGRGVDVLFDTPPPVNIPDPNLRAAIETALGKAAGAPITVVDMQNLTALTARDANISNLTGLEHATNLGSLDLIGNSISNLSPLSSLINLTDLMLDQNSISDVSSLSGLTNLWRLTLTTNSISDVSPLSGLTNLSRLKLYENSISDVSALSGLTTLTWLNLGYNSISDVSALAGLTNLTGLTIYHNAISDLSPLVANTGLGSGEEVDARGNPLNTASINTHIPALQQRGVEVLFDTSPPVNIPDPNLRAAIETALGKAAGAPITVADMGTLTSLTARDANISDLTGLEGATNLTGLVLGGNSITDLSPLVANTGLGSGDTVNVRTNPLNRASIQTHIPALQSRGVTVEFDNLTPTHHLKVSGDNQRAIPGTTLEQPFVVEVRDQLDKPLSGVQVTFLVTQGGGTLSATSATTNTAGRAESILTLGPNPGTNTVTVSVAGIQDGQTFTAEGVRIPLAFWIITGFDQNGLVGEALAAPFVVEVRGQSGGPFPDAEVTFTVISGGGTLSVTSATTDTDGRAESILTLGPNPGTNTVTVSVAGIEEERIITAIAEYALGTGISFAFSKTPIHLGDSFTLDVRADNVTDLAGWQFDIVFDRAALEAIEVSEGDFLKSDGGSTFFQSGQTNNATGKITGLIAGRTSAGGVSGSGSLLKVEFKAKSVGETELALENLLLGSATGGNIPVEPPSVSITVKEHFLTADVNRDGVVNILDLIIVAQRLGTRQPPDSPTDINGDGIVNILDLTLIAQGIGAAAPGVSTDHMVQSWIAEGRLADDGSMIFQEGVRNLETLLASIFPAESALLPNYPNPFNPETWIPYQLSEDSPVSVSIYDTTGQLVRTLSLGFQSAGFYNSRARAAYWDGRNAVGERVASGIYFYQLATPAFQQTRRLVIVK